MCLQELRQLVKEDFNEVDKLIVDSLHSQVPLIHQISEHIIHSGGKRLRPLLVLVCARACDYEGFNHLALAAVIEFIHTATLLHDDVVDAAELRRGKTTANHIWGNEASVLVGDFLYTRAFQLMMQINHFDILNVMANATNTIAEGEVLQLTHKHNVSVTEQAYLTVIQCKTAKLFEAATASSALLANLPAGLQETTRQFGHHLGMAYQLIDDALDYQAEHEALGKKIGQDLEEGKTTLPLIYLLKHGTTGEKELVSKAILQGGSEHLADIQAAIQESRAIDYTLDQAKAQIHLAKAAISELPDSVYRQGLIQLADFIITRQH